MEQFNIVCRLFQLASTAEGMVNLASEHLVLKSAVGGLGDMGSPFVIASTNEQTERVVTRYHNRHR